MECRESRLSGYPMIQCIGGNASLNWWALCRALAIHSGSEPKSTTEDAWAEGVLLRSCERSSITLSSLKFSSSLDRLRVSHRCQWAPFKPRWPRCSSSSSIPVFPPPGQRMAAPPCQPPFSNTANSSSDSFKGGVRVIICKWKRFWKQNKKHIQLGQALRFTGNAAQLELSLVV